MPTPVGHTLFGLALGLAAALPRGVGLSALGRTLWRYRVILLMGMLLANLPDVDYVRGVVEGDINRYHHQHTHTLGFCLLAAGMIWAVARRYRPALANRLGLFSLLCLLSHVVLDLFCHDGTPPYGVMALWPFTDRRFLSPAALFPQIYKANWAEVFQWVNVRAMLVEAALVAPVVGVVVAAKCKATGSGAGSCLEEEAEWSA